MRLTFMQALVSVHDHVLEEQQEVLSQEVVPQKKQSLLPEFFPFLSLKKKKQLSSYRWIGNGTIICDWMCHPPPQPY